MSVPSEVVELVERFRRNPDGYKRDDYKETRVRVEFVDPFFEALGWDVRNVQGYSEQYKDVVHEDVIKVNGASHAPDYCFRIGGTRKFFLEVKKPSVGIREDVGPAYQLRRYAWSAKLPLSVLTDFEEFAVYDCRQKPVFNDKASVRRVMYLTFDQYLDRWDEIHGIFAKESLLQGSFDRYVQETKGKRGTSEVDAEFLKEIEGWRETLARNIALRNAALSVYELNFGVQRTIDRIIFLRIAEDRGIEDYGRLLALTKGPHTYQRMHDLYRQADEKYNAGLFDFQTDKLTKTLTIDDNTLKPILNGLYYPQSPYEFSVLPADILGHVYEQFLGKVIRLTAGHRAKVEEKPEVKKAGGVYYTPTYIVDYIVKQTVGKVVEGKTPRQIRKLRFLDPACGSGSFLLGAYQYLLDHHRQWYEEHDPAKHAKGKKPAVFQGSTGSWRLTTAEKKRILLNNIFGVDIDRQAVEVTKLSLLLKVLEGETDETLGQQLSLWRERALPDLVENIKCGNSLIGPDFFDGQLMPVEDEMRRVNPFDWQAEFPEAMAAGGFDGVIGNPPYVRVHNLDYDVTDYLKQHYQAAYKRTDISVCFLELALRLLAEGGLAGFITSIQFFVTEYGKRIRHILNASGLREIIDFQGSRVFRGAITYTGILVYSKRPKGAAKYYICAAPGKTTDLEKVLSRCQVIEARTGTLGDETWSFAKLAYEPVLRRMEDRGLPLKSIGDSHTGLFTGLNSVLLLSEDEIVSHSIESGSVRPVVMGKDPVRYGVPVPSMNVIYPYKEQDGATVVLHEDELRSRFPKCYAYLVEHKLPLMQRRDSRKKLSDTRPWYSLTRFSTIGLIESDKILTPGEVRRNKFCIDRSGSAFYCARVFAITADDLSLEYLLGLMNSRLAMVWLHANCPLKQGGYYSYNANILKRFPIRTINFDDPSDVTRHDKMVALVERMLDLDRKLAAGDIPDDKKLYQRQIAATDRQIDALVYELYGLTEKEIKIVEEATN